MNAYAHAHEKTGLLQITGGIHSGENALAIKAAVEDLPGVYDTEVQTDGIRMHFDPGLVSAQQFYTAAKLGGFHARDFFVVNEF